MLAGERAHSGGDSGHANVRRSSLQFLGAKWFRPSVRKMMLRVVVDRLATLKADRIDNCRAYSAQDGCLVIRSLDRGPRLQDERRTVDDSCGKTADREESLHEAWVNSVLLGSSPIAKIAEPDTHVDAHLRPDRDGGSIPPASTN